MDKLEKIMEIVSLFGFTAIAYIGFTNPDFFLPQTWPIFGGLLSSILVIQSLQKLGILNKENSRTKEGN